MWAILCKKNSLNKVKIIYSYSRRSRVQEEDEDIIIISIPGIVTSCFILV